MLAGKYRRNGCSAHGHGLHPYRTGLHPSDCELSYWTLTRTLADVQIENIITSYPANSVGSTRALAVTSEMKSAFSKQQAEMVLASCVSRGWLKRSK